MLKEIIGEAPYELVAYSMRKTDDKPFISHKEFEVLPIHNKK